MLVLTFSVRTHSPVRTISAGHLGTSKPSFLLVLEATTCPHYVLRLSYDLDELREAQKGENSGPTYSTVWNRVVFPLICSYRVVSLCFTSWRCILQPEHFPEKTAGAEAM